MNENENEIPESEAPVDAEQQRMELAMLCCEATSSRSTADLVLQRLAAAGKLVEHARESYEGHFLQPIYEGIVTEGTGENILMTDLLRIEAERQKRELVGSSPSGLEAMMAERIVIDKMTLDGLEAEWRRTYSGRRGCLDPMAEARLKRIDRVHQRFLASMTALAKMQRPGSFQVNIGEKQINLLQALRNGLK